ncbi:MAG: hypothetical protein AB7U20_09135 [Planctomycetaceae bacterium]
MNLRQTAEVAALASMRAEELIHRPERVSATSLHGYWKTSRVRLRCWFAGLRSLPSFPNGAGPSSPIHRRERVRVARSILAAELLTRVWSAVLTARDAARSENIAGDLVRNVFQGQLEAKREVLHMLSDEQRLPMQDAEMLDRFRQRVERWTDLLLGPLVQNYGVAQFALDPQRALESVRCASAQMPGSAARAVHPLTLIGLFRAIPRNSRDDHAASALDWAVAQSVLSGLARADFDSDHRLISGPHRGRDLPALPAEQTGTFAPDPTPRIRFADFRRKSDPHWNDSDA